MTPNAPADITVTIQRDGAPAFVLHTADTGRHGATVWLVKDITGWHSTPAADPVVTQAGASDYSVAAPRFAKKARELTIHGSCFTPSPEAAEKARSALAMAADAYSQPVTITVAEPVPKTVTARTAGPAEILPSGGASGFAFSIPLICPDPFRYGTARRTATTGPAVPGGFTRRFPWTFPLLFTSRGDGLIVITNHGTAPSPPLCVIRGPIETGWKIVNETTSESLAFAVPVGSAETLTIDHKDHTALLGQRPVQALIDGTWWTLRPGPNRVRFLSPDSTQDARLTITAVDAYL